MAKAYPKGRKSAPFQNLTGRTFGRWSVVAYLGYNPKQHSRIYHCRCECGVERSVHGHALLAGRSTGCRLCGSQWKHGHCSTSYGRLAEYDVWLGMMNRCIYSTNPHTRRNYADRGITVCQRWRESFPAFLEDMGPRPSPSHSIDRIDNNGHYEPGNCRWATTAEQARNKRTSRLITIRGETRTLTQWARHFSLHPGTVSYRLACGMSEEEALTTPRRRGRRPKL